MVDDHPVAAGQTVTHLVELHRSHERATTPFQRIVNGITDRLGRPATLATVMLLVLGWMAGNYLARRLGNHALEKFPFPDLAFIATVAALLIALAILTTQQHQNQLADRRAELTLQIALLSERKVAKVIQLLEEQRRDNPLLSSRIDAEAQAMQRAPDPQESINRLGETS